MLPSVQAGFLELKLKWITSSRAKPWLIPKNILEKTGFFHLTTLASCLALLSLAGCSKAPQNNQPVKQQAAQTTQQIKSGAQQAVADAKAAAASARRGIKDVNTGLKEDLSGDDSSVVSGPEFVNINYSSVAKLMTLPGMTREGADLIIHNRPYDTPLDLVYKHAVTKAEYKRIVHRVVAWDNLWASPD
jgi:DNA uptake protein ComE-like DNA-binding protein